MSHLTHEVCGVDFFVSYNKCNASVSKLVESLKNLFARNLITYYSNDYMDFNNNYLQTLQVQTTRCKIFLFIIDKYSLECEWFLYNYIYAQAHSKMYHLPILIPIVHDEDLEEVSLDEKIFDEALLRKDLAQKKKLLNHLIRDCKVVIRMSEMDSYQRLVNYLKELVVDIVPFSSDQEQEYRFHTKARNVDNKRPINNDEERFFRDMRIKELDIMKGFEISRLNMRSILPKERVFVALSVPYYELSMHLTTMINVQCHLVWMDAIQVNKVNYFNFLWMSNDDDYELALVQSRKISEDELIRIRACPPSFMIFYDLNPAQLEHIHQEFVVERNWNLELIESYSRVMPTVEFKENRVKSSVASKRPMTALSQHRPASATRKSSSDSQNPTPTTKSNEEFFYICQFRNVTSTSTPYLSTSIKKASNNEIVPNKLRHSIIDTRFKTTFKETVRSNSKQMYIPIRIRPLVYNVNTVFNKHLYYTSLFKPVDYYKAEADDCQAHYYNLSQSAERCAQADRIDEDMCTSQYSVRMGLNDLELMELYNHNKANTTLKLCDLKAYKDEKQITRFLTIWTSQKHTFYEGISQLFIGLNKSEVLAKIHEMGKKNLHPRMITNYGYLNNKGEHVYAIFFCQF